MIIRRFICLATAGALTATLLPTRPAGAQSAAPLVIHPSGTNRIQLVWPATTNFNVLQEILGFDATNSWQDVPDAPAVQGTRYSVRRDASNNAAFYRLVNRGAAGASTLPDPASVAPAPLPNVFNDFAWLTAFLYTGSNAVQVGVAPGTITAVQAAVIRGKVQQRNNSPLAGVRVAILGHPEFGYTYTRTNGMFDMAVNAAAYTVDFQAIGYCAAQRQVQAPAQGYRTVPDVILVPMDVVASPIQFGSNAPPQMATGSPQTDAAGTRSATVFFPAGTTATMVMPDGSSQPVGNLTIRVTEFTVGTNGPAAMPAALPPTSGYTYCAEFSSDEAADAGATSVRFNQPVPVYVDNFLAFPVGTLVPIGAYDRGQGVWVPSANGIVMQVLGSTNGAALIDLHGMGLPETAGTLATNGFTTEELQSLALLYPAGKTLWRSPVPHFSIWDFNLGAFGPDPNKPNKPGDKPKCDQCDTSAPNYGTLNFSAQTFAEQIPLVGVPFNLNYNSARVPDYRVNNELTIPVAWHRPVPPPCLGNGSGAPCVQFPSEYDQPPDGILVETDINGELSDQALPAINQTATISWDGRDAYGRLVGGTSLAKINIAYEYTNRSYFGVFGGPELAQQFPALFGNDGNVTTFRGHIGATVGVGAIFEQLLTYPDHRGLGFGGWSPTVLHRLDPVGGILYYGDGRIRSVPQESVLGNFQSQLAGNPQRVVAAAPDGSVYFDGPLTSAESENCIFRRLPGGTFQIVTVPTYVSGAVYPNGEDWSKVDGQPVTKVSLGPVDLAAMCVGPDGSVYVTDSFVIARLTPDGIWHVIMGLGAVWPPIYQPDGTPATNSYATQGGRVTMAVGPDSSVYFTGGWSGTNGTSYYPIRKIAPNGRIYTVYGATGSPDNGVGFQRWETTMGTSAFAAQGTGNIEAIAVANDGTIYVSPGEFFDGGAMFKISPAGVILPFLSLGPITGAGAGFNPNDTNNTAQIQGDEGRLATQVPATSGSAPATTMAVGPDGSVYFTVDGTIIWRVNPNGILERVAGRYASAAYNPPNLPGDGGDSLNTYLNPVEALTVTPDDTLVLVRASTTPLIMLYPGRSAQHGLLASVETQNIPSEDGSEVYVFSQDGRHLSTLDGLTGTPKWSFGYDANSLVVNMTDVAGNVTQIERDASGKPIAIVGPYGQRTALGVDANGFLGTVTNPASETTMLTNSSGGLLLSITRPLGDTDTIAYDSVGRAIQVTDPIGGGWTDSRSDLGVLSDYSYEVDIACTNSVGDTLARQMLLRPNGETDVYYSQGGHLTETAASQLSGDSISYYSDGSALSTAVGADPRFGNQAEQSVQVKFGLPNGLVYKESFQRSAGLTNQADPFSFSSLTNVTMVNSNSYTEVYNASNRADTFTSPEGRITTMVRDALGRLIHIAALGQPAVDISYDAFGRMLAVTNSSSAGVVTSTFGYDALGRVVSSTDALGRTRAFGYDTASRLNLEGLPDGSVAIFTQDSESHLTSVAPPGQPVHTFQYNPVGLLTKYIPPLVGADESIRNQYDTERNLTETDLPDGQKIMITRGLAGRIDQLALGSGPTFTYQYGPGNENQGFPTNVVSSTGDNLRFDYQGPFTTNTTWSGTITGSVSLNLNADLLLGSMSISGSSPIEFTYDNDDFLIGAGPMVLTRNSTNALIIGTTVGNATDQREYNDNGLLTSYTALIGGNVYWSIGLAYDAANRITNKVETMGNITQTFGYSYDRGGRIAQVWQDGALATTYTYDTNGNRLSRNAESGTYDAQDRVITYAGAAYVHSPNGGLVTETLGTHTTSYSYNARGTLLQAILPDGTQIDYLIDAMARRIGKKVNGVLQTGWLYDGDRVVAELDGQLNVVSQFVYGDRVNTPSLMIKGGKTYRIFSDERGSVRSVIDVADGAVAQLLSYDEFGRITIDSSPGFQPFGFAGGLYDSDTQLLRFGMRAYHSTIGRWTTRDPSGFQPGSYNLYTYVEDDPVNFVDLDGKQGSGVGRLFDWGFNTFFLDPYNGYVNCKSAYDTVQRNSQRLQRLQQQHTCGANDNAFAIEKNALDASIAKFLKACPDFILKIPFVPIDPIVTGTGPESAR